MLDRTGRSGFVIGAFLDVDLGGEDRFHDPVVAVRARRVSHAAVFAIDLLGLLHDFASGCCSATIAGEMIASSD